MSAQALQFLKTIPIFASLPKHELEKIARHIYVKKAPRGTVLAQQGKTPIDEIFIVRSGMLELFYTNVKGEKMLSGSLQSGDIFGGISLLMNAGVAVRTVTVERDASFHLLSKELFMALCRRYKSFYQYFVDAFSQRMLDESYASIIGATQAFSFLSQTVPFSFLPDELRKKAADEISLIHYAEDTVLCLQGKTELEHLYIIQRGAAERYYEKDGKKTLKGLMGEGDIFGGISILLNRGIAVRSLRTIEDAHIYLLPRKVFLDICQAHEPFSEYFTDTFGKRMLDKSYRSIITQSLRPRDDELPFLNQAVSTIIQTDIVHCPPETPIQDAASVMKRHSCSSIFVKRDDGHFVGVITDNDLRNKVIADGYDIGRPVSDIMSSPLITVSSDALIFESLMTMMQHNIKHLAVTDADERVVGILSNQDLINAQGNSPLFLIRRINTAASVEDLTDVQTRLPHLAKGLISSGAKARNVTRLVTTVADAVLKKLIGFALDEMGTPPARFAFMIMGIEGRREQTFKTDQDNAIVFEDVPQEKHEEVKAYFLRFGELVCTWLDQAGYAFCEGDVMAKNPRWCQSLASWKKDFHGWIHAAEPEDLLQSSIFFDFRGAHGDMSLVDELRNFLFTSLEGWAGFFRHLTENALHFRPPIGFFRNFVVESRGKHRNAFDIKGALVPIVDFARIYALKHRIDETNTLDRLQQLSGKGVLSWDEYNELEQSYCFMMQLRFVRQITAVLDENEKPDNYINPKKLSRIEQTMLREIFKRIEKYQSKLEIDFTGVAWA
jgi:CBS domain-containing protein